VAEQLLAAGWEVRVLDDFSSGREENLAGLRDHVELLRGDVRDPAMVARAVAGVEVVFHQAAIPSVPRSVEEPIRTNDVNVGGTLRVLEGARRAGARRVVFAASSAAYGDTQVLPKVASSTASSTRSSMASRRWRCATSTSTAPARTRTASTRP
jgi:UDP-glucose 4-epimerase